MNTILSHSMPLAFFHFEGGMLIPVVAIIMPFLMIICIQVAKTIGRTQQERMRYEVMRAAIERGQPIPPEALRPTIDPDENESFARKDTPENDIRAGLVCVGVGAGLFLLLSTFSIGGFDGLHGLRWVGAIPGFIGVALLLSGFINRRKVAVPEMAAAPHSPTTTKLETRG